VQARGVVPTGMLRGAFWRLASADRDRLRGRDVVSRVDLGGRTLRLRLPLHNRTSWALLFDADRLEDGAALAEFRSRARGARCIVDIGVNVGLYLYHAAAVAGDACVLIGIEPNADLVALVRENLARNAIAAEILNAAATSTRGEVELYLGSDDQISSLDRRHVEFYEPATETRRVSGVPLDDLLAERHLSPDIVKIDVEGHELEVLRGARQTLATARPALLLEARRDTAPAVAAFLRQLGYSGRRFDESGLAAFDPSSPVPAGEEYANFLFEVRESRSRRADVIA
jgi:FkbM family methyltransferase